ncbi:MAG: hypothetical protein EBU90_07495 [Proteobacteria bacterium]|nr:hypothetical protein [Pseudomonadota bacterium]NBP13452.1 hypothetical protein [bacterium]
MSKTKNYDNSVDKDFKIHKIKKNKSKLDKHKKIIYNMVSVKNTDLDDDFDELYGYAYTNGKIKQR